MPTPRPLSRPKALALVAVALGVALAAGALLGLPHAARAQLGLTDDEPTLGTAREMDAIDALDRHQFVRARELAQELLAEDPDSIIGQLALGEALHKGDGNLPRALFLIRQARARLEARAGDDPQEDADRFWYLRILNEEAQICADMDLRDDQLAALRHRDKVFEPRPGDQIWALIKLERWDEAREVIELAMNHQQLDQVFRAMNGLCALEFELRRREESFTACHALADRFKNNEVAWSNTAESALMVFRHEEAERYYLTATELFNNSYGSPWRSLAMIYLLEGRVTETLSALKQAQQQRMARPSYTHQQDQANMDTATASLMIALGRGQDAERIGRRVYERPDRAGGTSASGLQIETTGALLFWTALQMRLAELREAQAARPWYQRLRPSPTLRALELEAWTTERRAIALVADQERLNELLRPHLLGIVNVEIWMIPSALHILGPGVAREALRQARQAEEHPRAEGYFDAFEAEITWLGGDDDEALALAERAMDALPGAEVLLRARLAAIAGAAADGLGREDARDRLWSRALEDFPAVFRLLDISIPVNVEHQDDALAEEVADALLRSPRFHSDSSALTIRVERQGQGLSLCLYRQHNALHGCAEIEPEEGEEPDELVARAADRFHELVMSPKLDLSQADVRSLDGSLATGRARQKVDEVLDDLTR